MIVAVFRARLNPAHDEEYRQWVARMSELARLTPGYISHKGFQAEDGERVTVVEFDSEESVRTWARHPEHVEAKKLGRKKFYAQYRVQVCSVLSESTFPNPAS
jgi:heme-degrading monooxygenase HmoA